MDKVAHFSIQDRQDLFSEAAAKLGIRPTLIEKDFRVCLVLKKLFVASPFRQHLVFKGGTSLSNLKVYGLIERFSEDLLGARADQTEGKKEPIVVPGGELKAGC